jgi:ABC-type transport system substrate-binding protein
MDRHVRWLISLPLSFLILVGCANQSTAPSSPAGDTPAELPCSAGRVSGSPKRVTAIVRGDVPTLLPGARGAIPGVEELEVLVTVGLTTGQGRGEPFVARLAETLPTTENGLWTLLPDGRMEVTWKLRGDVVWHDGNPITADDVLFTTTVQQDQRLPLVDLAPYKSIESIAAPDARTLVVRWKHPYVYADKGFVFPLPKHLLEVAYQSGDMERFQALPYWTEEFVGTGPYRVRQWMHGIGATLEANERYFLGRPKIDQIDIKFMPDPNTIATSRSAGGWRWTGRKDCWSGLAVG